MEWIKKAVQRPRGVATSADKSKWYLCPSCNRRVQGYFEDTKLCYRCDLGLGRESM